MEHINKNNIPEQGSEQPWQQADLSWEAMKDGIYHRIEQEDPDFFPKERRRRVVPFWFTGLAILVLVGSVVTGAFLWYLASKISSQVSSDSLKQATNSAPKSSENSNAAPLNSIREQSPKLKGTEQVVEQPKNKMSNEKARSFIKSKQTIAVTKDDSQTKELFTFERNKSLQPTGAIKLDHGSIDQFSTDTPHSDQASSTNTNISSPTQNPSEQDKHVFSMILPLVEPITLLKHKSHITLPKQVLQSDLNTRSTTPITAAKKHWTLAMMTNCDFAFTPLEGIVKEVELRNAHSSPVFGFGYGVRAYRSGNLGNGVYLGAGMQHLYQNIDISTERTVNVHAQNVLTSITHYVVGQRDVREYRDTIISASEKNRLVNYNKYQIAQIEFGMTRNYQMNKWNITPTFGNSIGYLLSQKGYTVARDGGIFAINKQMPVRKALIWQLQGGLEIGRQFGRQNRVQFAYQIGYSPLNWSAEAGIGYRPIRHQLQIGVAHRIHSK